MYQMGILAPYVVRGSRRLLHTQTALKTSLRNSKQYSSHCRPKYIQQCPPYLKLRPWNPIVRLCAFKSSGTHGGKRTFLSESLPPVLIPPVIFTGLLVALWTYKCLMTVVFQEKIIYMPYMPPFARSEKIADYAASCRPVEWREERIRSIDGTKISLCVGLIPNNARPGLPDGKQEVIICYFQGNGSSSPPRLPLLSQVLKLLDASSSGKCTIIALSYRGYWTSSGKVSQKGIELDAQAMLKWVAQNFSSSAQLILWGQSIGAGVASTAAAHHVQQGCTPQIAGLIMETPFTRIKSMLIALYPQKWLPYRYLYPLLRNHWDSGAALRQIAGSGKDRFEVLLMSATRDEVVPPEEIEELERICKALGIRYKRKNILGALHTEATSRREGQQGVAEFVRKVANR
ncbi:hypothetical protein LTR91_016553 [Friedmanniomyces endolithicus]|uniref:AB hydrolase-1 domain-containing protein n=1 Tax=Friedmanniomyces endolithicus TaxID=329885 RepID=A0AAN6K7P3_9PEZI|nr:hypothetical protein LTR59_010606 [Friedmanniomyces endolithicus]KAK0791405.1 hypothetical protein LTR75_011783 [Friedmanniomyces endolithicus]KAK0792186.1 hypothetical protein LTR38_009943 [Friedmanniomyces endolithicus]KAK0848778.1 hypothetical protein LTR03_005566 [Friedmanniomyces endolithicus]KAK0858141.1 hypothetical protein LTS02_009948 [Friedmanniomyces endolithicus]